MLGRMNPSAETQMAIGIGPQVYTESESFYRAALESLSEGVMILGADCRIIYANKLVYEITGYSPEELLGQTPTCCALTRKRTTAPLTRLAMRSPGASSSK